MARQFVWKYVTVNTANKLSKVVQQIHNIFTLSSDLRSTQ